MKNSYYILTICTLSMLLLSGCGKEKELSTLPRSVEAIPVKSAQDLTAEAPQVFIHQDSLQQMMKLCFLLKPVV